MRSIGIGLLRVLAVLVALNATVYLLVNLYTCGFGGDGGGGGAGVGLLALSAAVVSLPIAIAIDRVVAWRLRKRGVSSIASVAWTSGALMIIPLFWFVLAGADVARRSAAHCLGGCIATGFTELCQRGD